MTLYPENFSDVTQKFITDFFGISDTAPPPPSAGEDPYVTTFTPEGQLKMGATHKTGWAEIGELRQGMWAHVATRHHVVSQVFAHSPADVFLEGTVEYGLKNGRRVTVEWASHMRFEKKGFEDGWRQLEWYQVYIDTAPVTAALAEN